MSVREETTAVSELTLKCEESEKSYRYSRDWENRFFFVIAYSYLPKARPVRKLLLVLSV